MLKALWSFRWFIVCSMMRDLQKAYYGKALFGSLLILIRPLFLVFVYTIIFSQVMKHRSGLIYDSLSYTIYLGSGIFTWFYFSEVINKTTVVFVQNGNILNQSYVPRSSLPLITLFSATINFIIIILIFLCFLLFKQRLPGWELLGLIPLMLIQQAIAMGIGVLAGALNVYFRDTQQILPVVVQAWFWLTPIVYPIQIIPENFRHLIQAWNPIYPLMEAYHNLFLNGTFPDTGLLINYGLWSLAFVTLVVILFRYLSRDLADEL